MFLTIYDQSMTELNSGLWVGAGSVGMLLVVVFVMPLLRR